MNNVFAYHLWKAEDPTDCEGTYHRQKSFGYISDVLCVVSPTKNQSEPVVVVTDSIAKSGAGSTATV